MDNYENTMQYINEHETTDISFVKVGNGNKKLIVSFATNGDPEEDFFQRKTTLLKLRYGKNNFDILFLRNQQQWYLGGLNGIGKNINHTLAFFKKEFAKYDKVLCIGASAGGYASLLFGSLLNVDVVIAINPQTDLQYCIDNLGPHHDGSKNLIKRAKQCPTTWGKYNKLSNVLSNTVSFNVVLTDVDEDLKKRSDVELVLHGRYHYEQIKHLSNVHLVKNSNCILENFLSDDFK